MLYTCLSTQVSRRPPSGNGLTRTGTRDTLHVIHIDLMSTRVVVLVYPYTYTGMVVSMVVSIHVS